MYDEQLARRILQRLTESRTGILMEYPFFGTLLMHLRFGISDCKTAYTDMERIVFDPNFVNELEDEELTFVLLHEVLHCVLSHCLRGKGFEQQLFNVACDIVVNSSIMQVMGVTEFEVAGETVMHLTPTGEEGYQYSAEEIYHLLLQEYSSTAANGGSSAKHGMPTKDLSENNGKLADCGKMLDNHEPWRNISPEGPLQDEWKDRIVQANGKYASKGSIPQSVRKLLEDFAYQSQLNWKRLLREFLSQNFDEYDYTYNPPDRRYIEYDLYLQSFRVQENERVEKTWFCVDTSGSITNKELNIVFAEIKEAVYQWRGLSGKVSFFDTKVTEPEEFSDISELEKMEPKGGGGTDFHAIFQYMEENMSHDLPRGIVILTDGYAAFPDEEAAYGVPVLWLIINSKKRAPWGNCVQVTNE